MLSEHNKACQDRQGCTFAQLVGFIGSTVRASEYIPEEFLKASARMVPEANARVEMIRNRARIHVNRCEDRL
jgi:hypothetical protein